MTGNPTPNVTWYSNGNDISSNGRSTTQKIQGGFMIRFKNVHPILHNGTMSCEAINGVDSPVTDTAILNVLIKCKWTKLIPGTTSYILKT